MLSYYHLACLLCGLQKNDVSYRQALRMHPAKAYIENFWAKYPVLNSSMF